ncbi:MAG TPA: aldehyde dehydrogenase family protein, partial [Thermomicrobiales bacterium]|nr:aldehyde dehydrogenase family protein [Thermomicrobiales bacterium]
MVAETKIDDYKLLIGGKMVDAASGETFDAYNPATNQPIAKVAKAGAEDVDRAVAAARKAFDEGPWARMAPSERGRVLQKIANRIRERADEIGEIESRNTGKPIARAKGEILGSAGVFEYYAGAADKFYGETLPLGGNILNTTWREPVGVAGQIVPWNFPFMMAAWKGAPALATGCTIILKPASNTPLSAVLLGEICYEAGVPEGVVNVLPGPGGEIGEYMSAHPEIDKIAFTGETATGARILKASADTIKKVSLELGGKSPNIIFADADLEKAAAAAVPAAFGNSGQVCTARTRLFVGSKAYDDVMQVLVDQAESFKVGDPMDSSTLMGPVISRSQWDRVTNYVDIGKDEGAELDYGGARPSALAEGHFIQPTIFGQVSNDMRIAREEIFGPVL